MRPRIIVFVGTVGAGKSTQMRLLASQLKRGKIKVKTTFLKSGHLLVHVLGIAVIKMLGLKKGKQSPVRVLIDSSPNLLRRILKLWLILDALSIFVRFMLTIRIPLKMKRVVIVEEYLYATIADYIYLARVLGLPFKAISSAVGFMLRLLQLGGPTQTFFLDAPNTVLRERWRQRLSLNEREEYLEMQRALLLSIAKLLSSSFLYIETSGKTVGEINKLIINHLRDVERSSPSPSKPLNTFTPKSSLTY